MKFFVIVLLVLGTTVCFGQSEKNDPTIKTHPLSDSTIYPEDSCEIIPCYPGGTPAWQRYLNKNMHNPNEDNVKKTVLVQFIVDVRTKVSNVKAIEGPLEGGFREEAERLIRNSGSWVPAIYKGKQVNAYKKIKIDFN